MTIKDAFSSSGKLHRMNAIAPAGTQASPVRTLFVNHASKLGGAEQVLLSVLRSFDGTSALWLFEDGPMRREAEQNTAVRVLLPSRPNGFAAVKRDRGMLASALPLARQAGTMLLAIRRAALDFDVVYANSQKAFVLAAAAARLARKPLVWHLHDILLPSHFGAGQRRLLRSLAPLATRIIVPSTAAAQALVSLASVEDRVRVIPNGVTLPPDPMPWAERKAGRSAFGVPPDVMLVGVFSRLSPWKGQDVLIRALPPGVHCLLAGDALFGEDDYVRSLHDLVAKLGLTDRVHFIGHRADVPNLMRMVDAMVHPSIDPEPFGRTLVEAMLCGTPIIATDAGAVREILQDGRAGLLVEPGSAPAIAAALDALRTDPAASSERVRTARGRALERYAEATMCDQVGRVIREARDAGR